MDEQMFMPQHSTHFKARCDSPTMPVYKDMLGENVIDIYTYIDIVKTSMHHTGLRSLHSDRNNPTSELQRSQGCLKSPAT